MLRPRTVLGATVGRGASAIVFVGVVLIGMLVLVDAVDRTLLGDRALLLIDSDASVAAWVTVCLLFAAAQAWALLAWRLPRGRLVFAGVAAICAGLSLEAVIQVHTAVETSAGFDLAVAVIEPLLAIAVLAIVLVASRRLPRAAAMLLIAAIATLVVAQGLATGGGLAFDELNYDQALVLAVLEEVFEILTAVLLLAAAAGPALKILEGAHGRHGEDARLPEGARSLQ